MLKRRDVNKMFLASALLPFSVNSGVRILADEKILLQLPVHFIYENRAIDFGLEKMPTFNDFKKVHYIEGDVTRVWYEELHYLWQNKAITTAGLTRESEFFILKTLARDYGYQVSHEMQPGDSQLVSWLLVPADTSGLI